MKNNLVKLTGVLLLGTLALGGCKKGENDPFLSLRSRDARVTGEWKLTDYNSESTTVSSSNGTVVTSTSTAVLSSSLLTTTSGGSSFAYSFTEDLTINDDGTFTQTDVVDAQTSTTTADWTWMDDTKDKVKISLDGSVYYIDELKNSEMVLMQTSYSKSLDSTGDYTETTTTVTLTYTKQ